MPRLTSIDTFSGSGGNALALHSAFEVLLYCEVCPKVTTILHSVMEAGMIDKAPVQNDIRTILASDTYKAVKAAGVHLVSGSFPCQENSSLGKRTGMNGERSGLLRELCSLTLDADAPLFFAENVPGVVRNGSLSYLIDQLSPAYDIAYGCYRASELGFMHDRRRFFAVAVKRGGGRAVLQKALAAVRPPVDRSNEPEPPRMVSMRVDNYDDRMSALGNAVVPMCSYTAFVELGNLLMLHTGVPDMATPTNKAMPFAALIVGGQFKPLKLEPKVKKNKLKSLAMVPASYKAPTSSTRSRLLKIEDVHTKPVPFSLWATPRKANYASCQVLTKRSSHDLGTQLRFERDTPNETRGGFANPNFVEWLMSYPTDYTLIKGGSAQVLFSSVAGGTAEATVGEALENVASEAAGLALAALAALADSAAGPAERAEVGEVQAEDRAMAAWGMASEALAG
jgi:hypothetical protein